MKTIQSLVKEAKHEITDIARKLKEAQTFQQIDWHYKIGVVLEDYLTQASQNGLKPLPEKVPNEFIVRYDNGNYPLQLWDYIRQHFGTLPAELNKLREELETERISHAGCGVAALGYYDGCDQKYLSASLQDVIDLRKKYDELLKQQPPPAEWWHGLKKGDKFIYDNGVDHNEKTFTGKIFLGAGSSIFCDVVNCSPYTSPTDTFRSKLTPELQAEFDELMKEVGK